MNLLRRIWRHYFPRLQTRTIDLPALSAWDQSLGKAYHFYRRDYVDIDTNKVVCQELWSCGMGNGVLPKQWDLDRFRADGALIPLPNQANS